MGGSLTFEMCGYEGGDQEGGGFIKSRACLDDLKVMYMVIGFMMPALDMNSDELHGAKDRYILASLLRTPYHCISINPSIIQVADSNLILSHSLVHQAACS